MIWKYEAYDLWDERPIRLLRLRLEREHGVEHEIVLELQCDSRRPESGRRRHCRRRVRQRSAGLIGSCANEQHILRARAVAEGGELRLAKLAAMVEDVANLLIRLDSLKLGADHRARQLLQDGLE